MLEPPSYLLIGRGRWAALIDKVLFQEKRLSTSLPNAHRKETETDAEYRERLMLAMAASRGSIAWVCLPFGSWTAIIVEAAMRAGLDVIAECPWLCPPSITDSLLHAEQELGRAVAVHYEYCMLEELARWRPLYAGGAGCTFHGIFSISRPGRHGAVARQQLGSHLLAMRRYASPLAQIGSIRCSYEGRNQRLVSLEQDGREMARIDFLANQQPIIQRFLHAFEAGRNGGKIELSLAFAKQVAEDVRLLGTL